MKIRLKQQKRRSILSNETSFRLQEEETIEACCVCECEIYL